MTDTPAPLVTAHIDGHVATITLNRPDKRNALNDAMLRDFLAALDVVEADASVRAVILRGEGSSFCSGVDLGEKLAEQGTAGAVEFTLLLEAFHRLEHHANPIIAVLQGTSLAGGWELALHCDVRFAAPTARFGMPLVKLGLVVPYPAATRLVHLAGAAAATDLLLSGSLIDGGRAHQLGLVSHLADEATLLDAARDYANRIAGLAPLSVRETKRLLARVIRTPEPAEYESFDRARRQVTASEDTAEGLRAFLERRPARFTGR